jgi:segregation and condensation protein B
MIRFLLEKGFVQEVGRKDTPGRPVQFGTTRAFLMHFRLGSIADLPSLDPMELERFGSGEDEQG